MTSSLKIAAAVVFGFLASSSRLVIAEPLNIVHRGSPWSRQRSIRRHTRYIVLHTTEGSERGALNKLAREGEAHYLVGQTGKVYRIVDRRRVATHAGLSMWEGYTNLDDYTLGIEVVGYHNSAPNRRQIRALRELLRQLQSLYDIPDDRVLTHSMVAYGTPNRWHKRYHRGRKRCAMHLAKPQIRKQLGLEKHPLRDPDVHEGRLVVADHELHHFLYPRKHHKLTTQPRLLKDERPWGGVASAVSRLFVTHSTSGRESARPRVTQKKRVTPKQHKPQHRSQVLTSGTNFKRRTAARKGWRKVNTTGQSAQDVAGRRFDQETTIYLFPSGLVRTGKQLVKKRRFRSLIRNIPQGTRILMGYRYGGYITPRRSPRSICGRHWNSARTWYRLANGNLRRGSELHTNRVPSKTLAFCPAR